MEEPKIRLKMGNNSSQRNKESDNFNTGVASKQPSLLPSLNNSPSSKEIDNI